MRNALYERLTPNERLNLTLEALARRDFAEATRLSDTCPQYTYRLPDCEYAMRITDLMSLAALATAWAWGCAYRAPGRTNRDSSAPRQRSEVGETA
ncbi:MAG: hypothetical protein ACREX9_03545 [Gammaproteobacteria bacterium]